jgi:hypothetical protein
MNDSDRRYVVAADAFVGRVSVSRSAVFRFRKFSPCSEVFRGKFCLFFTPSSRGFCKFFFIKNVICCFFSVSVRSEWNGMEEMAVWTVLGSGVVDWLVYDKCIWIFGTCYRWKKYSQVVYEENCMLLPYIRRISSSWHFDMEHSKTVLVLVWNARMCSQKADSFYLKFTQYSSVRRKGLVVFFFFFFFLF